MLVVEQVETPDQLEVRKKETGSKDKVSGGVCMERQLSTWLTRFEGY